MSSTSPSIDVLLNGELLTTVARRDEEGHLLVLIDAGDLGPDLRPDLPDEERRWLELRATASDSPFPGCLERRNLSAGDVVELRLGRGEPRSLVEAPHVAPQPPRLGPAVRRDHGPTFEVAVNGARRCRAGLRAEGCGGVLLTWGWDPEEAPSTAIPGIPQAPRLAVGLLEGFVHHKWLDEPLDESDVVTVRVGDRGELDPPAISREIAEDAVGDADGDEDLDVDDLLLLDELEG